MDLFAQSHQPGSAEHAAVNQRFSEASHTSHTCHSHSRARGSREASAGRAQLTHFRSRSGHHAQVPCERDKFAGYSPDADRRYQQREKQISYGYVTSGYKNMVRLIEHDPLLKSGGVLPLAPPDALHGVKRTWDLQLRKWRRALHMFDYVFIDGVDDESQRAVILEEQRKRWVSASFTDAPKDQRVQLSLETLMAVRNSPQVPTRIPVEDDLKRILRTEDCYEPVANVVPQTASSLTRGTDISPMAAGIKIHIAPSSAILQQQLEQQQQLAQGKTRLASQSPSALSSSLAGPSRSPPAGRAEEDSTACPVQRLTSGSVVVHANSMTPQPRSRSSRPRAAELEATPCLIERGTAGETTNPSQSLSPSPVKPMHLSEADTASPPASSYVAPPRQSRHNQRKKCAPGTAAAPHPAATAIPMALPPAPYFMVPLTGAAPLPLYNPWLFPLGFPPQPAGPLSAQVPMVPWPTLPALPLSAPVMPAPAPNPKPTRAPRYVSKLTHAPNVQRLGEMTRQPPHASHEGSVQPRDPCHALFANDDGLEPSTPNAPAPHSE